MSGFLSGEDDFSRLSVDIRASVVSTFLHSVQLYMYLQGVNPQSKAYFKSYPSCS